MRPHNSSKIQLFSQAIYLPRLEIKHISLYNNTHIENTFRKIQMLPYPFSYFSSIWGFRKPLSKRFGLNWFQLLFTSLFLISLSMVPIAIQNSSQETYPLDTFIDNVYTPLTDEVVHGLVTECTNRRWKAELLRYEESTAFCLNGPSPSSRIPEGITSSL